MPGRTTASRRGTALGNISRGCRGIMQPRATKLHRRKCTGSYAGFGPAISSHFWDDNRFPAYTYDKISIGMIDAHEFAGDAQAFKAMDTTLDSVMAHLPPRGLSREQQYARPHKDESFCWDEPYTVPENAFLAWQRGAGSRYKDLGVRFLADDWYWDPLATGQNVLPDKHAYSHVNAMSSRPCRRTLCWGMRSICGRRGTDLSFVRDAEFRDRWMGAG